MQNQKEKENEKQTEKQPPKRKPTDTTDPNLTFVPLNVLQAIFNADADFGTVPLTEKITLWYFVHKQLRRCGHFQFLFIGQNASDLRIRQFANQHQRSIQIAQF